MRFHHNDCLRELVNKQLGRPTLFDTLSAVRYRICPKDCADEATAAARNDWEQGNSQLHWERIAKANARARIAQACGRTAANVSLTHRCRPRVSYSHNHRVRPTAEGFHYRADPHAVDAAPARLVVVRKHTGDVRPLRLLVAFWETELRTQQ